ncbi:MAG: triose-phosphate isomerase [Planctomycetota bacterium]|jgi:triosephosphate isomerase|nr:triose-phosphate isomerase [Planctomycetota bacterium]
MKRIFVNLKRFEVAKSLGGICPDDNPTAWMKSVVKSSMEWELGRIPGVKVAYLLPEALIAPALEALAACPPDARIGVGCQGVYREDVVAGGNFGAFSSNRPAAAAAGLGCGWTMNGHSEERRDKLGVIACYDPGAARDGKLGERAAAAVEGMLNAENKCALSRGLNLLFCVGETAEQKGLGGPSEYEPRVKAVVRSQLKIGLDGAAPFKDKLDIVVGYEPIWAIGPGKTPPGPDYIAFISAFIKETCEELHGFRPDVVYGGGLKEENAGDIASVKTVDGGLVALTKFTQPIGFDVQSLRRIIDAYVK